MNDRCVQRIKDDLKHLGEFVEICYIHCIDRRDLDMTPEGKAELLACIRKLSPKGEMVRQMEFLLTAKKREDKKTRCKPGKISVVKPTKRTG